MLRVNNLNDFLIDLANAIRKKTNTTCQYYANDFDNIIRSIDVGVENIFGKELLLTVADEEQISKGDFVRLTSDGKVASIILKSDIDNIIGIATSEGIKKSGEQIKICIPTVKEVSNG